MQRTRCLLRTQLFYHAVYVPCSKLRSCSAVACSCTALPLLQYCFPAVPCELRSCGALDTHTPQKLTCCTVGLSLGKNASARMLFSMEYTKKSYLQGKKSSSCDGSDSSSGSDSKSSNGSSSDKE